MDAASVVVRDFAMSKFDDRVVKVVAGKLVRSSQVEFQNWLEERAAPSQPKDEVIGLPAGKHS